MSGNVEELTHEDIFSKKFINSRSGGKRYGGSWNCSSENCKVNSNRFSIFYSLSIAYSELFYSKIGFRIARTIREKNVRMQKKKLIEKFNESSIKEISKFKGIGKKKLKNIVKYIQKNGKIDDLDQLINVKGIGKNTLKKIQEEKRS